MELQIENLKAQMRGETLNNYQQGLALDEYYKLIEHTENLENKVKTLNIDDVSERILLVRWMDGNPILDGAEYFIDMDEALERYNEIPKFKNVEYTICKIKNAR